MSAHVAYVRAMEGVTPVPAAKPRAAELVADAATGSETAQAGDVALVTANADVYVTFGATPDAPTASNGHLIKSGTTRNFGMLSAGDKMRVASV